MQVAIDHSPTDVTPPTRDVPGAGTRERVLELLLELGPSTTTRLAERLALSSAGVRRHLDALLAEGTVTCGAPRQRLALRGRGRPARLWALTDAGHAVGPSAYDDLAAGALRYLSEQAGEAAVGAFAAKRVGELEARYAGVLDALPVESRPAALAAALTADGYAAAATQHGSGVQLCQHHCPVHHVARQFPQLCDAETAAFGRLLGGHVQRLATIAHGDGVCTTYIPAANLPAAHVPAAYIPAAHTPAEPTPAARPTASHGKARP